jgi:hypothetical protein
MSATANAFTLTIGAALGAGWVSSFGKAGKDIQLFSGALDKLKSQQDDAAGAKLPHLFSQQALHAQRLQEAQGALTAGKARIAGGDTSAKTAQEVGLLQNQVETLKTAYEKTGKAIETANTRLARQGIDATAAAKHAATLADKIQKLTAAQAALTRVAQSYRSLATTLTQGLSVLAATAGGMFALAKSAAASGDAIAKQAALVGMSTAALQEYHFAAQLSGISSTELDANLSLFTRHIGEAAIGTGKAATALRTYGIDADTMLALPMEKRLAVLADTMRGITSKTERATLANAMFGGSGQKMVNLLQGGSSALAAMRAEAREKDFVFSPQDSANAERFSDAIFRVKTAFDSIKNALGAGLFVQLSTHFERFASLLAAQRPVIVKSLGNVFSVLAQSIPVLLSAAARVLSILGRFPGAIYALVAALASLGIAIAGVKLYRLGQDLHGCIGAFRDAAPVILAHVKDVLRAVASHRLLQASGLAMGNYFKGWGNLGAGALGAFRTGAAGATSAFSLLAQGARQLFFVPFVGMLKGMGALFIGAFALLKGACVAAFAAIAAVGWPVIAAIAAIAGAALLIYKFWEPISAFFGNVFSQILGYFKPAIDTMSEIWTALVETFEALKPVFLVAFAPLIATVFVVVKAFQFLFFVISLVFRGLVGWILAVVKYVKFWANLLGAVASLVIDVFKAIFTWDFSGVFDNFLSYLSDAISSLVDLFPNWLKKLLGVGKLDLSIGVKDKTAKPGGATATPTDGVPSGAITLPASSTVPPLTHPASRQQTHAQVSYAPSITVNAAQGQSPQAIADAVMRQMERKYRAAQSGSYRDLTPTLA